MDKLADKKRIIAQALNNVPFFFLGSGRDPLFRFCCFFSFSLGWETKPIFLLFSPQFRARGPKPPLQQAGRVASLESVRGFGCCWVKRHSLLGGVGRKDASAWPSSTLEKQCLKPLSLNLGARLRGRTATQRSKKGSEKGSGEGVLRRFLRRGPAMGFAVKKGSEKGSQKGF